MSATKGEEASPAAAASPTTALDRPAIPPETDLVRRLLESYSGVAPQDVDALIYDIRDKALAVTPHYGCVRSFWFLNLHPAADDPRFRAVAARLAAPGSAEAFLDAGCCVGHVVRHLAAGGVPGGRLFGTDLQARFLELGYELFRDRGRGGDGGATFVAGDLLADEDAGLDSLAGRVDVIYAAALFHLFEYADQARVARRMVRLLRPENPRAMVFGRNQGVKIVGWERYVLDPETWQRLWDEVGEATGTRWRTEMDVQNTDDWLDVRFAVHRVV